MTDAERQHIAERIEPQRVYDLFELQALGIPPADVLQAAGEALLARWLGEGRNMHAMGEDVRDWLLGNKPWERPDSDARLQSDTTGHRMPRLVSRFDPHRSRPPISDPRATIGAPEPPE